MMDFLGNFCLPLLVVFGLGLLLYKMFLKEQERLRKKDSDYERLVHAVEVIASSLDAN